jgi:hypothetical protein
VNRRWGIGAVGAVGMLLTAGACSGASTHGAGVLAHGHNVSVFRLKKGDCVVPPTSVKAEISQVEVVPCSAPHTQEVFALCGPGAPCGPKPYTGSDTYPGSSALKTFADGACLQQYKGYVGVDYRDSSLFYTYLLPSARSWNSDQVNDRTVVCLITTTGQPLYKPMKDSGR